MIHTEASIGSGRSPRERNAIGRRLDRCSSWFLAYRSPEKAALWAVFALLLCVSLLPAAARAHEVGGIAGKAEPFNRFTVLMQRLTQRPLVLTDAAGNALGVIPGDGASSSTVTEREIMDALTGTHLEPDDAAMLWELFANEDSTTLLTPPIVMALLAASDGPKAREAFWSELGGVAKEYAKKPQSMARARSLLGFAERHRESLRPLYESVRDTESSGDEMVDLMLSTKVFGADFDQSLAWVTEHNAAAVARRVERERGRGRPVTWENAAFEHMLRWKEARMVSGAPRAPRSLAALDAVGEAFIVIFNSLHDFDEKYRNAMLRGLGPVAVFNAVVGGELELYRLGTSSYRDFLHAVVMRGIKESGSLEAFLERAAPKSFGDEASRAASGRGMVLLRVVSSFGLLDDVLKTVADRQRFVGDAISSLGDPVAFEGNASVMLDLLTMSSSSSAAQEFQRTILDQLYARYGGETSPRVRTVYGSVLSVYQTMTGVRRVPAIDREFVLDESMFRIPFARLFSPDGQGGHVHRMFMRFDQDVDASATYASFLSLMRARHASVRYQRHFDVYRLAGRRGRAIEIYANKPTAAGVKQGISDIAASLRGKRVETVIGRGHTAIVTPLQKDARQILGDRVKEVATVVVGTCGGDASVRDLIATFGYSPFFTTRSTGRQAINNALIETYIAALMALSPDGRLHLADMLNHATARFLRKSSDAELREDASFYRLSMTSVLAAYLFDTHVRPQMKENLQIVNR